jgi:hypothetical protein
MAACMDFNSYAVICRTPQMPFGILCTLSGSEFCPALNFERFLLRNAWNPSSPGATHLDPDLLNSSPQQPTEWRKHNRGWSFSVGYQMIKR